MIPQEEINIFHQSFSWRLAFLSHLVWIQLIREFALLSCEPPRQLGRRVIQHTATMLHNIMQLTYGRMSRHITEMFYHMIPAKYLATADSDIRILRDAHKSRPARFIFSQRSSRVVRPALTFTVYAYISTRLGRLTFSPACSISLIYVARALLISSVIVDLLDKCPMPYTRDQQIPVELVNPVVAGSPLLRCPRRTLAVSHVPIAIHSFTATSRKVHHLARCVKDSIISILWYFMRASNNSLSIIRCEIACLYIRTSTITG